MRVKIGDVWFDAKDQPLAVQFTDEELAFIQAQDPKTWENNTFGAGAAPEPLGEGLCELLAWVRKGR